MSQQTIKLGGEGGKGFQFNNIGDEVTGRIISMEEVQQTDLNTGNPKFWDNGGAMTMWQTVLQTQLRNGEGLRDYDGSVDDGRRTVYLRGSKKAESQSSLAAVLAAVRTATGSDAISIGGDLTLRLIGFGQASRAGHNPPKLYEARYQPPTQNLGGQQAQGQQQGYQQAPQQQYAQPGPAQQQYQPAPQQQPYGGQPQGAPAGDPWGQPAPGQQAQPPF